MNQRTRFHCLLLSLILLPGALQAAEPATNAPADVLCRGKGFEIRRPELEGAVDQFRANAVSRGQQIPDSAREELEAVLLDRLVVTRLLLTKATEDDRRKGKEQSSQFVSNVIAQAGSESAYQRQLLTLAYTRKDFEAQVEERAICEEVIERELAPQTRITDEQVKARYEEHKAEMQRPDMVRASHILLSFRDPATGQEFTDAQKAEKKATADKVLARARKGEDFAALAKEFSEDPGSKDRGGEYLFARGQMVKEFENAAFSMETNQISDIVTTQFGYHIIKLLQKVPAETVEFAKVKDEIHKSMQAQLVQKELLPGYLDKLRRETSVQYFNGARPPAKPTASEAPAPREPAK